MEQKVERGEACTCAHAWLFLSECIFCCYHHHLWTSDSRFFSLWYRLVPAFSLGLGVHHWSLLFWGFQILGLSSYSRLQMTIVGLSKSWSYKSNKSPLIVLSLLLLVLFLWRILTDSGRKARGGWDVITPFLELGWDSGKVISLRVRPRLWEGSVVFCCKTSSLT
jgi:hypothetical protein